VLGVMIASRGARRCASVPQSPVIRIEHFPISSRSHRLSEIEICIFSNCVSRERETNPRLTFAITFTVAGVAIVNVSFCNYKRICLARRIYRSHIRTNPHQCNAVTFCTA
jgi:hypothetical protein